MKIIIQFVKITCSEGVFSKQEPLPDTQCLTTQGSLITEKKNT